MTVLVTGGAGYIGSHTVRRLRGRGYDVVVLDTLEYGSARAVLGAPLVVGDIADERVVAAICRDYQVSSCIHFAGYKNVGESLALPGRYWQNNVGASITLLDTLVSHGVGNVVFSSSCSVYGSPDSVPVSEVAPVRPQSVYAETKATTERILQWYSTTRGLGFANLRYFNASGASTDGALGEAWQHSLNLIPVLITATLGLRAPARVFGNDYETPDGTVVRDYIHVEDLADAHVRALAHLEAGGEPCTLNLSTGHGTSVLEVIEAIEEAAGRRVPYEITGRRAGDPALIFGDPSLAEQVLGWRATRQLRDIITSAWRWHAMVEPSLTARAS